MKSILIIGIGSYGRYCALKYMQLGHDVMVVDQDEEKVAEIASKVTSAQIGDCTKEEVLRSLGVNSYDICVVSIGDNFQASLEITSLLKELGASWVISMASKDNQAKFLLKVGADSVVYPNKDSAEHLAMKTGSNNVFEFIELTTEVSIYEIPVPSKWIGKSIQEIDVRNKYGVSILAVKVGNDITEVPSADYTFVDVENEHLIVMGKEKDIYKMKF